MTLEQKTTMNSDTFVEKLNKNQVPKLSSELSAEVLPQELDVDTKINLLTNMFLTLQRKEAENLKALVLLALLSENNIELVDQNTDVDTEQIKIVSEELYKFINRHDMHPDPDTVAKASLAVKADVLTGILSKMLCQPNKTKHVFALALK